MLNECLPALALAGLGPESHGRKASINEAVIILFPLKSMAEFPEGKFPVGVPGRAQVYTMMKLFEV